MRSRLKYRNVATVVDGKRFSSKREAKRYQELKLLERAGRIFDLRTQVPFDIVINDVKICRYVADFAYFPGDLVDYETVEDCKGFRTPVYKLKRALMLAVFGIKVKET